jgi:hypothetical protein
LPVTLQSTASATHDRVRSSAAGDLILHYQVHWRLIHGNGQLQAKQRARLDARVHRTALSCARRAHSLAAYRAALDVASRDVRPAVDVLAVDVAALCARVASIAAIVALAEREQSVHAAFARASELDLESFRKDPLVTKRPPPAPLGAASLDDSQPLDAEEQRVLESFLGAPEPKEQEWSDEEPEPQNNDNNNNDDDDDDDDDAYFGDK